MRETELKAYAKINLGLDVLRKREDGYHELRMIMQTVSLYDRIRLTVTESSGIRIRSNLSYVPSNENNLAWRAAALLMEEFHEEKGLFIDLQKCIPVAAGLAGGSSDAAAVLVGVNRLFGMGLSREDLMRRAVKIGADVPYCVMRGTALAEGIGEKLTALPSPPDAWVVLVRPPVHVSTKFVYGHLRADRIAAHPDIDGQIAALERGDLAGLCAGMGNVLEEVTAAEYPQIARLKEELTELGADGALMSGSGPTVFGLFSEKAPAEEAVTRLRTESRGQVYLAQWFPGRGKEGK